MRVPISVDGRGAFKKTSRSSAAAAAFPPSLPVRRQVVDDAPLLAELVAAGVHFEVCPTSSFETGGWTGAAADARPAPRWRDHPLRALLRAGAAASLSSDDPSVFATTLVDEFALAERDERDGGIGLTEPQLRACTRAAIDAAFVGAADKARLHELVARLEARAFRCQLPKNDGCGAL